MNPILFMHRWNSIPAALFVVMTILVLMPVHGQAVERLFFASDIHCRYSNLHTLLTTCGPPYEVVGLVGDYGGRCDTGYATQSTQYDEAVSTINDVDSGAAQILSQGNHESDGPGEPDLGTTYSHPSGEVALSNNEFYDLYVINWDDLPGAVTDLETFLASRTGEKVVFIMCHAPLHSTREDINTLAAVELFDTLQEHGNRLDIVFLWGHTHQPDMDYHVDYTALPGEPINTGPDIPSGTDPAYPHGHLIGHVEDEILTFTYVNAGYVIDEEPTVTGNAATVISVDDREIRINGCGGHDTWDEQVVRKSPRVVLLFDTSGSMSLDVNDNNGVPEEEQRLTLTKHAAEAFVEMLGNYEGTGSVGVVAFPDHPQSGCNAEVLRRFSPVPDADEETALMEIITGLTADGSTPMRAGLEEAAKILGTDTPRAIVMLTDGYHNCPHSIDYGSTQYEEMISDLRGIKVYPIGFARPADTDRNFLQGLADGDPTDTTDSSTGQFSDVTFDPILDFDPSNPGAWTTAVAKNALTNVYANIMADILGLGKIVDPIASVGKGQTNIHKIAVNGADDKITFLLSWHTPDEKRLGLRVKSSDDQVVPIGTHKVRYRHGSTYKILFVDGSFLKIPGKVGDSPWKLEVTGNGVGIGKAEKYQYSVITDSTLKMAASLDRKNYGTGDAVTLQAKLTLDGDPLPGLKDVTVRVTPPTDGAGNWLANNPVSAEQLATVDAEKGGEVLSDLQRKITYLLNRAKVAFPGPGKAVTLHLHDDGSNGDAMAGDGVYTNRYPHTLIEGTYSFAFQASGSTAEMGLFSREKLIQRYVGVNTSPEAITLKTKQFGTVDGKSRYLVSVTPKDAYGNYLGPRFSRSIDIALSKGALTGELTDNLDGTYSQLIELPNGISWKDVAVTVAVNNVSATLRLPDPQGEICKNCGKWFLVALLGIAFFAIVKRMSR